MACIVKPAESIKIFLRPTINDPAQRWGAPTVPLSIHTF
jgi:hypothetical protein